MWGVIREGIEEENDDIDPHSIFIAMGKDELTWVNAQNIEQTMTRDSFKNLVTSLRKNN